MSINAQLSCNNPKLSLTLADLAPLVDEDAVVDELDGRIVFAVGVDVGPEVADPDAAVADADDPLEPDKALEAEDLDEPELDADDLDEPEDAEADDLELPDDPALPDDPGLPDCDEALKR